jgi:transcriptional regulator GlxA family with amidase domain
VKPKEIRRIPVYVVLPPQTLLLDLAGPMEVLRGANRVQSEVRFDVRYIGPSRMVRTSIGIGVGPVDPLPKTMPDEAMVVISGTVEEPMVTANEVVHTDQEQGERAIVAWLKEVFRREHTLVTVCSGALLAARAGLLDGYACTTHHGECEELAAVAPKARVLENRLYVEDRRRFTSAGITSGIDLMLHIVGKLTDHGCTAAIARNMVVYLRRSGEEPQLSPWLEGRNHIHPAVHRVQDAITADPSKAWTLGGLARLAGASSRHLTRLFHEHTGMSINDYKNRLRVALAHELLTQTQYDMERVAESAGFGSTRQLRRAWGRVFESSPRDVRAAHA